MLLLFVKRFSFHGGYVGSFILAVFVVPRALLNPRKNYKLFRKICGATKRIGQALM
jgi:hypothetical protein